MIINEIPTHIPIAFSYKVNLLLIIIASKTIKVTLTIETNIECIITNFTEKFLFESSSLLISRSWDLGIVEFIVGTAS
jgi:hypothetical protein